MQTLLYKTAKRSSIITFLLMILVPFPISAQGIAEVWLNKATEKLQNKGTEIAFHINEDGIRINGKLLIDERKFAYDTEDMKIWYDGTTQWTLQQGGGYNELYINNPSIEEQQSINPYLLLNSYKEYFTAIDGGEKSYNGKPVHMVKLNANESSQGATSINLYIYSDGNLAAIELISSNEHTYKIEMRSMRSGLTFPKDTFTYPEKEISADEVIDLR